MAQVKRIWGVDVDKSYQLSDWRVRLLEDSMRRYAVGDTLYLIDLYDRVNDDLMRFTVADHDTAGHADSGMENINGDDVNVDPIMAVLQDSAKIYTT